MEHLHRDRDGNAGRDEGEDALRDIEINFMDFTKTVIQVIHSRPDPLLGAVESTAAY